MSTSCLSTTYSHLTLFLGILPSFTGSLHDSQVMEFNAQLWESSTKEDVTSLSSQFACSFISSQVGHILYTLKLEVSNGAMRYILKRKRRRRTEF